MSPHEMFKQLNIVGNDGLYELLYQIMLHVSWQVSFGIAACIMYVPASSTFTLCMSPCHPGFSRNIKCIMIALVEKLSFFLPRLLS